MKKLVIVALVAFSAVCANAASINWKVTGVAALPDGTKASSAMVGYWFEGSAWDTVSKLAADKVAAYAIANGAKGTTTDSRGAISFSGSFGNYNANQAVSGFFVALSEESANAKYYAISSSPYTGTIPSAGTNLTPSLAFGSTSSGWQSVPEPTSGLLMLLGMAGLALRRRRA